MKHALQVAVKEYPEVMCPMCAQTHQVYDGRCHCISMGTMEACGFTQQEASYYYTRSLGMDSDMGKVWKPTLMEGDQASWAIAHMLGDLVEVQEGIWMEMNISGTHQNELRAGWRIWLTTPS